MLLNLLIEVVESIPSDIIIREVQIQQGRLPILRIGLQQEVDLQHGDIADACVLHAQLPQVDHFIVDQDWRPQSLQKVGEYEVPHLVVVQDQLLEVVGLFIADSLEKGFRSGG